MADDPQTTDQLDGNRPLPWNREQLGRMVREAWVRLGAAADQLKAVLACSV